MAFSIAAALAVVAPQPVAAAQPEVPAAPADAAGHLARIAAFEQVGTPADPAYVDALGALSLFYVNQGRYSDALPVLRRALEASRRIHGSEHQLTQEIGATLRLAEAFVNRR